MKNFSRFLFLITIFCGPSLSAMDNENNQNPIDFLESRLEHHAKEINILKTENEDLKKQLKSLLPNEGRKTIQKKKLEQQIIKNNRLNPAYQRVIIYEEKYGDENDWEIEEDPIKKKIYFLDNRIKDLEEKELKNKNNWKFGNISQGTKALICFSITALFLALTVGLCHSCDIDTKNEKVSSPKKFAGLCFCAVNSFVWFIYSMSQIQ